MLSGVRLAVLSFYRGPSAGIDENELLIDFLRHTTNRASGVLVLGDFNAPEIEWEMEYAPVGSFGDELLEMMHGLALTQHVTDPSRWRLGNSLSTLDLVFTKSRNDIKITAIGAPLNRSDHASIRCQCGCALPFSQVKLRRRYGRMNTECLQAAAQTMV
ncbi:unnamed protein product [Echinostoma caproni]|uniref:Endo/exonuclease/phosphatase domain-containing protein n=1 Tax=Echinostoma caproni TaxID=27848 RepID=A0A183A201_9TREM|nr:unnamed protein product [Echinostoma caproni]